MNILRTRVNKVLQTGFLSLRLGKKDGNKHKNMGRMAKRRPGVQEGFC
jgi:hypothetical protein